MARKKKMKMIREVIRIFELDKTQSSRTIAKAAHTSHPTVLDIIRDYKKSGLQIEQVEALSDLELIEILQGERKKHNQRFETLSSKFEYIAKELKRKGVTLTGLWGEYKAEHPDGYEYTQFTHYYRIWRKSSAISMHMNHKAGDKMFIDFAGKKLHIVDRKTGKKEDVETFVAILPASHLTYVEASENQKTPEVINCTENAMIYFDGVPAAIVPDNLTPAVKKACKYDPEINPQFAGFAAHYDTVIMPTRPRKPKDKALVEGAVNIVYQWIYAPLRNRTFYSISELNAAIWEELEKYNNRPMQIQKISRRQLYNEVEKEALKPLPAEPYEYKSYQKSKVDINYHFRLKEDNHYYSVPYAYRSKKVDIFYTRRTVEVYHKHFRIAFYKRNRKQFDYTTLPEHMPSTHRFVAEWNSERFIKWAESIGPDVKQVVITILESKTHPEQGFKSCMGVINLQNKYGKIRLNNACAKALYFGYCSYNFVKNILANNLDAAEVESEDMQRNLPDHENVRGNIYYH